ncbi:hypothetical protein AK812_SmicGene41498 [Symbiodinium microadriaticum]|uniref:Uncharacterized protein n=1 Tax=Symbiodinium microadriaticum TaxID=2951 RepID=A0A1Q9C5Y2_SYMMI|nr:hypothetical protein AK812_SmicGene41498 [Symbiodinium microadriaticum]
MTCSTGCGRRLRTLSPQSLEVGLMAGTISRQLAYSTRPITSASSAACRRVPELGMRSQAGLHPGERLRAIPTDEGTQLLPLDMQVALRLRLPLPSSARCGEPGCRTVVDQLGDHRAVCARSGLLARLAPIFERAWVRVAREAVTAEGRVVSQQWLARTTAPGVAPDDRRRLDLVIYGASRRGEALCCDVTLVSPLRADGPNALLALMADEAAAYSLDDAAWLDESGRGSVLEEELSPGDGGNPGWARRWWSVLSVALQRAVASSALGVWTMTPLPGAPDALPLGDVLDLAIASAPSRLPLR